MSATVEMARSFTAMNTDVETVVCLPASEQDSGEKAFLRVRQIFHEVETTLSRFNADSELSRLNKAGGVPFLASNLLFTVVTMAKEAANLTGGIYDPAILPYLLAAGYDRSFEKLSEQADSPLYQLNGRFTWRDINLEPDSSIITMPPGCGLDLGGIGKGWTVDRVCESLRGLTGYAIDAGGDMVLGGRRADGSLWSVGVADPLQPQDNLTVLELSNCAICTSTTKRRSWHRDGIPGHHLIDPRTGKSASSTVISATVIAESAMMAELIAKTALILGPDEGMQFIRNQPGTQGIFVLNTDELCRSTDRREVECVL